jgi:hypothetical protein
MTGGEAGHSNFSISIRFSPLKVRRQMWVMFIIC